MFESLEHRTLLSTTVSPAAVNVPAGVAGPQIVSVRVVGPPTDASGVVITFNESMDPATAQDRASYVLVKHINKDSQDDSGGFFDIPFTDNSTPASSELVRIHFSSAVYDDATHSVTLTPKHTFEIRRRFRILRVAGRGDHAITDAAGMPLDGNNDGQAGGNAAAEVQVAPRPERHDPGRRRRPPQAAPQRARADPPHPAAPQPRPRRAPRLPHRHQRQPQHAQRRGQGRPKRRQRDRPADRADRHLFSAGHDLERPVHPDRGDTAVMV